MDTFKETEDYFQFIRPYQEAMDFLMVQIKILNEDYRENIGTILSIIFSPG